MKIVVVYFVCTAKVSYSYKCITNFRSVRNKICHADLPYEKYLQCKTCIHTNTILLHRILRLIPGRHRGALSYVKTSAAHSSLSCHANLHDENVSHAEPQHERRCLVEFSSHAELHYEANELVMRSKRS